MDDDNSLEGVLVWAFNVGKWKPTEDEFKKGLSLVQEEEQKRIGKFMFEIDKKRALGGRLLIRYVISKIFEIPFKEIQLNRTKEKKPYWERPKNLNKFPLMNFNVSHHGDYVVIACSIKGLVGCDVTTVELPKRRESVDDFLSSFEVQFTPLEWNYINNMENEEAKLHQFHRLWTLKETYIKAVGIGLGLDLQTIEFKYCDEIGNESIFYKKDLFKKSNIFIKGKEAKEWVFGSKMIDNMHLVSVGTGPFISSLHDITGTSESQSDETNDESEFDKFCIDNKLSSFPLLMELGFKDFIDIST